MIREVCLFDKFSFCKNGVKCLRIHLKEVCQNRECDYRKCNKRHPGPCRIFRMNGFCRFGTSCKYSHRLPKEVEEQNNKLESIEKVNSKLLKQVDNQNVEIKELKIRLLEIESKELKNLQKQIADLAKNNNEKEIAIKKLLEGLESKCNHKETNEEEQVELDDRLDSITVELIKEVNQMEKEDVLDESIDDSEEEEESREIDVERSFPFMMTQWRLLGNLKSNIENLRNSRSSKDFRGLLDSFKFQIQKERKSIKGEILITSEMPMETLNEFLDDDKQKCNKEEVMNLIKDIRKSVAGIIIVNFSDKVDVRDFCFL